MSNDGKKKIAFLFGAGAEGKGNFNMPTGAKYLEETLLTSRKKSFSIINPIRFGELLTDEKKGEKKIAYPIWSVICKAYCSSCPGERI